ncbi:MAG: 2Fe-2S iron-sulfur cluster binding domain-containing protein [Pseudolabrys sp.]|nr:2Fe-2S iron-sulfur cluster binding domain-containing protein [Pseudolabrys sp.]
MTSIAFTVNGSRVEADIAPRTHLGDFLRDTRRLSGTHLGCEHGICGACTVLIDGKPARSCITLAVACEGREITTIEGFDDDAVMGELREAFTREHGLQCGFCTPGMLIASRDIVMRLPGADEQRIREELSGNLCRCTGYVGIVNAVSSVAAKRSAPVAETVARPALSTFTPQRRAATATVVAESKPAAETGARQGWTQFDETFTIHQPRDKVWALFGDIPAVADCLPGAEVLSHDERAVKGRMTAKLGPIAATFAGSAAITRDPQTWSGTIAGAGSDGGSGSRTRGEIVYRLEDAKDDAATRVAVTVLYNLQGPLAQFSRSSIAQEFGRHLVSQFAANLNAKLGGAPVAGTVASAAGSLNLGQLVWAVVKAQFRKLFGGR